MCRFIRVTGDSLFPAYNEGDFVLISKIPFIFNLIKPGDVVVFEHKVYGTMIKRVAQISPDRSLYTVIGSHEFSVDSRQFGAIERKAMLGKVMWRVARPIR
jgi:nickel-type superoxide dismutase maturation protease